MSAINLTLCLTIEGIEETVPLVVEYTYRKAWPGGGVSPDEPACCEVQAIKPANGDPLAGAIQDALERLIEGDEFQALLMQDAFEDRCAAEEYRAEAIRDERMTREWEDLRGGSAASLAKDSEG